MSVSTILHGIEDTQYLALKGLKKMLKVETNYKYSTFYLQYSYLSDARFSFLIHFSNKSSDKFSIVKGTITIDIKNIPQLPKNLKNQANAS